MPHGATRSNGDHSSNAVIPPIQTFKPKRSPAIGGLRLPTLLIFAVQLILLGGTAPVWFFTSKHLQTLTSEGKSLFKGQPTIIFVHVLFSIAVLTELVFLERRIFRLRVERYSYRHPGEILLRSRHVPPVALAFAPWNRPPLSTYAAALLQRRVAAGDVEDRFTNPGLWQHRGQYPPSRQLFTEQSRSPKPIGMSNGMKFEMRK